MKLEKAIKSLEAIIESGEYEGDPWDRPALELLIEAGKYIIYRDNCPGINTRLLLPGETEE